MRVGIVVDGAAESQALRPLTRRVGVPNGSRILDPVYADLQPKATAAQIARSGLRVVNLQIQRGADFVVVLIDREDLHACPSKLAGDIRLEFAKQGVTSVEVVVKNRCFENWLIADPESLRTRLTARFSVTEGFRNRVSPNRADLVSDAESLLNSIISGAEFHKLRDATRIAEVADPLRIASNSRSFRRFLRVVGCPHYVNQSALPMPV